jgi:hypothetical protein
MAEQKMQPEVLTKAVKKYRALMVKGLTKEEVPSKLKEEGFEEAEIAEITEAIDAPLPEKNSKKKVTAASLNAELDLKDFDYTKLTGQTFKKYVQLVGDTNYLDKDNEYAGIDGELGTNDMYDFDLYHSVRPVRQARFKGVEGSPMDYVGLELGNTKPQHTTRIPVRVALEFNAQILNQHSLAGHGQYYLLKKV